MKSARTCGRLVGCLLLLVGGLLTMAPTPCNLKIAEYPGSSEKEGREGSSDVFAVDHEITQAIDPTTGAPSGVRQHKVFTVLKKIDKATPGLHKALVTGQTLRGATIDFYRVDSATGTELKYYTVTLTTVRIVGIKTMVPTAFLPENATYGHMEEVRMVYGTIEWNWLPDNIVELDRWRAGGASGLAEESTAAAAPAALVTPLLKPTSEKQPLQTPGSTTPATTARQKAKSAAGKE